MTGQSYPVSGTEERLARAIRKARDFDPDTLYQHLGDDYPIDSTDSEGRTFYKSWRKELPSVRAVLAELGAADHAPTPAVPSKDAQINRLRYAILGYFEVFDRCGGSESVSPETFAAARQGLREALSISSTPPRGQIMFGRTVSVDGTEIFVSCTPNTRYSEILERASKIMLRQEVEALNSHPDSVRYRAAIPSPVRDGK